jgi:LacI family transcriptional regulator
MKSKISFPAIDSAKSHANNYNVFACHYNDFTEVNNKIMVNQRQIAEAAQVSISTVSKALSGGAETQRLHPDTVQRIHEVAIKLGYQPNDHARALRSKRSGLIGVYFGSGHQIQGRSVVSGYVPAHTLDGIEKAVVHAGYDLLLINFTHALGNPKRLETVLLRKQLDGLICIGLSETPEIYELLIKRELPTVAIEDLPMDHPAPSVTMDCSQAISDVLDHLTTLGHRHIGFIGPLHDNASPAQILRFEELVRQLRQRQLPWTDQHYIDGSNTSYVVPREDNFCLKDGAAGMKQLLDRQSPVTAVIAYNDLAAAGVMQTLAQRNIHCPSQISVVGFGNYDIAQSLWPDLTTIPYPLVEMGQTAASKLLDHLQNPNTHGPIPVTTVKIKSPLVIRHSTGSVHSNTSKEHA